MEKPFLKANGTPENQLTQHLEQIRSVLPGLAKLTAQEAAALFEPMSLSPHQMANKDKFVSQFTSLDSLPKLTRKLLGVLSGITNNSLTMIDRSGVSSRNLVQAFVDKSPTGRLSRRGLTTILISCIAQACLSRETCDELAPQLRTAALDAQLLCSGLDQVGEFMEWLVNSNFETQTRLDPRESGLSLTDFAVGVERFGRHAQDGAYVLASMAGRGDAHVPPDQMAAVLERISRFLTQLELNIMLTLEKPLLLTQGIHPETLAQREHELRALLADLASTCSQTARQLSCPQDGDSCPGARWMELIRANPPSLCHKVQVALSGVFGLSLIHI
eukprot:TRINITY_DN12414_c0_g2_i2.p1 TRINITY_DN12414_c0_g2~~TRINITY_DN12414_c0_g2_i2.p1  ORF type:complete len:331 (+),score=78.79 TRINITY_DN12414_c0_g2_i2:487-1479(+)